MKILLFSAFVLILSSCADKKSGSEETIGEEEVVTGENSTDEGKIVYTANCNLCHGPDGTAGVSGAANLQKSTMNENDVETIISYGKGGMAPYKGLLSDKDIQNVKAYVMTLRK